MLNQLVDLKNVKQWHARVSTVLTSMNIWDLLSSIKASSKKLSVWWRSKQHCSNLGQHLTRKAGSIRWPGSNAVMMLMILMTVIVTVMNTWSCKSSKRDSRVLAHLILQSPFPRTTPPMLHGFHKSDPQRTKIEANNQKKNKPCCRKWVLLVNCDLRGRQRRLWGIEYCRFLAGRLYYRIVYFARLYKNLRLHESKKTLVVERLQVARFVSVNT